MNYFNDLSTKIIQQLTEFNAIYGEEIEPWLEGPKQKNESMTEGISEAFLACINGFDFRANDNDLHRRGAGGLCSTRKVQEVTNGIALISPV